VSESKASKSWFETLLLLAFMAALAGGAARHESVTVDELAHTAAGVSYLEKLDLRMNLEHPPLAKALAALPLVLRRARADYTADSWTFSGKSIFHQYLGQWVFGNSFLMHWNDPVRTLWWARVPMLLLTLLLGFTLCVYGSRLGASPWGGLLCLAVFVSYPAFLAFGPLVITDITVTLFSVLVVGQLPQLWHRPSRWQVLNFGLSMGGAFLSKFSAGLLLLVFPAVAVSLRLRPLPEQPAAKTELRAWRRRAWGNFARGILWAVLVVYLVYLVLSWNQPTDSFNFIPHFPASHFLRRFLMPLWLYFEGLALFALSAISRPTFILGRAYAHGVWFYFPVLFFLKSPLAFLCLLLLAGAIAFTIRSRHSPHLSPIAPGLELEWRCLWVSLVVFTASCIANRLDISIRHFAIPLALIILLLAPLPRMLHGLAPLRPKAARAASLATMAFAAAGMVTAIAVYPDYFPFLNLLSMGRPGYLLVNDSNLDWNQALPQVEKFASRRGLERVLLDSYGFSESQAYIPQVQLWDCQQPHPEDADHWAFVSANLLADGSNCLWLLRYVHLEVAGGSMYAFLLPDRIPAAGEPGGPPRPNDYRYFGGFALNNEDVRAVFYRCTRDPRQLEATMKQFAAMAQSRKK
jgi:hypothetical protein